MQALTSGDAAAQLASIESMRAMLSSIVDKCDKSRMLSEKQERDYAAAQAQAQSRQVAQAQAQAQAHAQARQAQAQAQAQAQTHARQAQAQQVQQVQSRQLQTQQAQARAVQIQQAQARQAAQVRAGQVQQGQVQQAQAQQVQQAGAAPHIHYTTQPVAARPAAGTTYVRYQVRTHACEGCDWLHSLCWSSCSLAVRAVIVPGHTASAAVTVCTACPQQP